MRVAFVTPRFVTEDTTGLSSYLKRMTLSLQAQGNEVEVFVSSRHSSSLVDFNGVKVHRIKVAPCSLFHRVLRRVAVALSIEDIFRIIYRSRYLCSALEARHRIAPFDLVQYSDYLAVGLFMNKTPDRQNIVRVSRAVSLVHKAEGKVCFKDRIREWLELYTIRQADGCYAPSRFVASYFKNTYSIQMDVIRPPCSERFQALSRPFTGLPPKYLIHFGELCERKGTDWLIESLKLAFKVEPSIRVVIVGKDSNGNLEANLHSLGEYRGNLVVFPPLPQNELFGILSGATAAIFPTLVDNLPNAVIESLQHGIPVIGSNGASIDELVEDGVTGELAEMGNREQLSDLIVKCWQGKSSARRGFRWGGLRDVLDEEATLQKLFQLQAAG